MNDPKAILQSIPSDKPVLIAGPTASGKSALALAIAERDGRQIVNADALQVFGNWRVLTARPSPEEEARAPHALYGHLAAEDRYSVGEWLRDVAPCLEPSPPPVIVGGTGLYFSALTEGLAEIPPVPDAIRAEAAERLAHTGVQALLAEIDSDTLAQIDTDNPARVLRAWEVQQATGDGLAAWQDRPASPLLPLSDSHAMVIDAPRDWLTPRIAHRFSAMLENGALEEARRNLEDWDPTRQSARAIGAPDLIAHLKGEASLKTATDRAVIATRQYAKRQRTWLRSRMKTWRWIEAERLSGL
ncbi:MAG: tRNA (adenosine(37)-N6)-dimethylallyltransferase MiaA [Pseudomonadota bacterium]